MAKHIFITGGVVSSLGKGLTAASIALLLKQRGYRIRMQKLDPYLNVDPGTMSPYQHGEVYVTEDGAETDLDLGHYERFTGIYCNQGSNYTTGRIYSAVIAREREGGYLGKTVQVIPHITDEIKAAIRSLATDDVDIVITEIGGTAGDIESLPFLEAIRQFRQEIGRQNGLFIHMTLVPYIQAAGEMKTKPSQQSVGILRTIGIVPDMLICRCERHMEEEHRQKLALFCNVEDQYVIEEKDVDHSIYEVPGELARQHVDQHILKMLQLPENELDLDEWTHMVQTLIAPRREVEIAVIGKYISLQDSYKSIYEALTHAGVANDAAVNFRMIEAGDLTPDNTSKLLDGVAGVLVPGGFGFRGIDGKIRAIQHARQNRIPFFGICLGMQCAVMEFARNVCGLEGANSTEFDAETAHPVIDLMEEQQTITDMGGTMRLGVYPCQLTPDTRTFAAYATETVQERHRHRYEFNNAYREQLEQAGMKISGRFVAGDLVEIVELSDHPWFVACQFHPEFKSTPLQAHPLFRDFVAAAIGGRQESSPAPDATTSQTTSAAQACPAS
ncbi:MAG: CTP synthase [Verrucomicrobia bacterium]|nr:CTP synthase [Verrucomicrobiota bacterium]MDA1085785.1 CTP synthase [Verrucomicrobiota bacterium]